MFQETCWKWFTSYIYLICNIFYFQNKHVMHYLHIYVYITWIPPIQPWVPYSTHTRIWEHRYCHSALPPFLNIWIQTCTFVIVYFYKNLWTCISAWKSEFKSSNLHAGMQTPLIPQPPHHPTQSTYAPHLTLIRRPPTPPHPNLKAWTSLCGMKQVKHCKKLLTGLRPCIYF